MKSLLLVFLVLNVSLYVSAFNLDLETEPVQPQQQQQQQQQQQPEPIDDVVETAESDTVTSDNLCAKLNCGQGEMCVLVDGEAACECIEDCGDVTDERLKVCTFSNATFDSECHFYREKCWCSKEDNKCTVKSTVKDSIDYFGKCQAVDKCTDEQKEVFPIRMKLWLDEVLNHLSKVKGSDIPNTYSRFIKLASETKRTNVERHWIYGVMFEFCQLDKSHDGVLNHEEMKELIIPIKALENCIQPFLQECDKNKDSKITDSEWAHCLDLSDADLTLLRDSCKLRK